MQRTFYHIIPPIEEQQKIADYLDGLSVEVQRLEGIYRNKLAALNELKQSILQKAFTGELTADTANQTIEAAKQDRPISKDRLTVQRQLSKTYINLSSFLFGYKSALTQNENPSI